MNLFTPKGFLQVGGTVLVLIAVLGAVGVIGPTDQSIFNGFWYFDNVENLAHGVLGVAGLLAAYTFPALWQRYLVMALGVLGVVVGVYSVMGPVTMGANLLGAQLQNPADTVLHLVVGAWALYASMGSKAKK